MTAAKRDQIVQATFAGRFGVCLIETNELSELLSRPTLGTQSTPIRTQDVAGTSRSGTKQGKL